MEALQQGRHVPHGHVKAPERADHYPYHTLFYN